MRVKEFCKKYKKALMHLLVLLVVAILLSGLVFLILFLTDVLQITSNGLQFNLPLFETIKDQWWSYLLYFLLQVVLTVVLCFVPGTSMAFIMVGVGLWGSTWQTFLLVFAGVVTSSLLMDFIGRFGGVAIIKRLFGEEDYNNGKMVLREKGAVYLPIMYLFPMFPDDMLCCLAGLTRIKIWYHLLIIILCRGVGVATIVYGIDLIPFETFTTFWDWIVFITVGIIWVYLIFKAARYIDKKLTVILKDKKDAFDKKIMGDSSELNEVTTSTTISESKQNDKISEEKEIKNENKIEE